MTAHPEVPHPHTLIEQQRSRLSGLNALVGRVAASVLGSMVLFWVTFLVPLLVLPASDTVKIAASVILSSWFQAWALPVLQAAANRAEEARAAKADADHQALTHVATTTDTAVDLVARIATALGVHPDQEDR